jgi:Flp pilus assembly protein TadB
MNMAKSKKAVEIDQGKMITVATIITGLIMSVLSGLITKNIPAAFLVLLTAIVAAVVIRVCNNIIIKRTANRFANDLDVIKQGDYSKFVDSKSFGVLGCCADLSGCLYYGEG